MCEVCQVLKEQIEYLRAQNAELLAVITEQLRPQQVFQQAGTELKPITPRHRRFSAVRAELEKRDRELLTIQHKVQPAVADNNIEKLEEQLELKETH